MGGLFSRDKLTCAVWEISSSRKPLKYSLNITVSTRRIHGASSGASNPPKTRCRASITGEIDGNALTLTRNDTRHAPKSGLLMGPAKPTF